MPAAEAPTRPSPSLIANLDAEFARHVPFAQMAPAHRQRLWAAAQLAYFEPDEVIVGPESGVVRQLLLVRSGGIVGERDGAAPGAARFEYEAGECFPVGALLADRAVGATYRARGDTFCLLLPGEVVRALAAESAPWADFLHRRVLQLLELSQRAAQVHFASQALAEQSLETPLARYATRAPLSVPPGTPLGEALQAMHDRGVGSVLVADSDRRALGILTRYDVLGRVALPGTPLATPVEQVMSAPLRTLTVAHRGHDAALLMSTHGVRHVPVTDAEGRLVGIVSERDLFALQRLSLHQLAGAIRGAGSTERLVEAAADIRRFAAQLLAQGVRSRQLTELISHLNDLLAARLFELCTAEHGLDPARGAWLAFGSEGRSEQTIATDQDNGLLLADDCDAPERERWRRMGEAMNLALDRCGYPLCKGQVMAGNPDCCLTVQGWRERFEHWIAHGAPADLLAASIFFDLRAIAGAAGMASPLSQLIAQRCRETPRFLKQMADNALRTRAPLNWRGAIEVSSEGGHEWLDLKLHGTAIFVEGARLLALAQGIAALPTRERLLALAGPMGLPADEAEAWVAGFEYLQMLRLSVQASPDAVRTENPNLCDVAALNTIDRRVLRESLRVASRLQQRIELDYAR